jgi:hypothetical protein
MELPQPAEDAVKSGKRLQSPEFVRVDTSKKGTRLLLILGPKLLGDPHFLPSLNEFITSP